MELGADPEVVLARRRTVGAAALRVAIATTDEVWRPVVEAWMLDRLDLEVVRVGSVMELLEVERLDHLDLAVLDHDLPGIDGLVAGAMLREINPAIRLILATASDNSSTRQLAEEIGFSDVMEKTEDGFELHRATRG